MSVWYTADLHAGHARIIELCQRPFASVEEMDEALVENWNRLVEPADTVWVLGDVAMGTKNLGVVGRLNGNKILVAGNHDSCWEGHKRWRRAAQIYFDAGFGGVISSGLVRGHALHDERGYLLCGPVVNLSHLPYRGDSHDEDRYADWRPADDGRPPLCGHVHEKWKVQGRQVNVGVDVWDYRPVAEEEIRSLVAELPPVRG